MIPSQHKVQKKITFLAGDGELKHTSLDFFPYLQITSQHLYILFNKTTHYAPQHTLIILSDHLIRSKEAQIFISHILFESITHTDVFILNLTPRSWCVVILMLWSHNPG